jgi:hypothetical protein
MKPARYSFFAEWMFFWALAAIVAWLGMSIPVHFRAISPAVLNQAGKGTVGLDDLARSYLDTGRIGPVRMIWKSNPSLPETEMERIQAQQILQRYPLSAYSGGSDPYLDRVLERVYPNATPQGQIRAKIVELFLQKEMREPLRLFLDQSQNRRVQETLKLALFSGFTRFPSAYTAAGKPLDASILLMALMLQSQKCSESFAVEWTRHVEEALAGNVRSIAIVERTLLGFLSLGRRMDWTSMGEWMIRIPDLSVFDELTRLVSADWTQLPQFFSAWVLVTHPIDLLGYWKSLGDDAIDATFKTLPAGRGGLDRLVLENKLLYSAPLFVDWQRPMFGWINEGLMVSLAYNYPLLSLDAKLLLLLISGYLVSLGLSRFFLCSNIWRCESLTQPLFVICNMVNAIVVSVVLWMLIEPNLLEFSSDAPKALRLDFEVINRLESLVSQKIPTTMLDQVTILVLFLFFFLQLVVYMFCLIKISEIKRQPFVASIKLDLLRNEEMLFDLGLYIGLGGTVASLILLAMGIVQASLIAAYASTMFGILFVAILKVVNLRPYVRRLLLEEAGVSSEVKSPKADVIVAPKS